MSSKSLIIFAILIVSLNVVFADQDCEINLTSADLQKYGGIIKQYFGGYLGLNDIIYAKKSKNGDKICIKAHDQSPHSQQDCSLTFYTNSDNSSFGCASSTANGNSHSSSSSSSSSTSY